MVRYNRMTPPEAIVMELFLIAKFGMEHGEIDPSEHLPVDVVNDAIVSALNGRPYGETYFDVMVGNSPRITVVFLPDYQIDEQAFDAKYGSGSVAHACALALQNTIEANVQQQIHGGRIK